MFVLYRTTKDAKWRERGWQIWEAIESKTRTESGYTSVTGVHVKQPHYLNSMPRYVIFGSTFTVAELPYTVIS